MRIPTHFGSTQIDIDQTLTDPEHLEGKPTVLFTANISSHFGLSAMLDHMQRQRLERHFPYFLQVGHMCGTSFKIRVMSSKGTFTNLETKNMQVFL